MTNIGPETLTVNDGDLAPKRRDIPANERSPLRTCAPSSRHCLVAPAEGVALLR